MSALYSRAFNQMLRNDPFYPLFSRSAAFSPLWNDPFFRSPFSIFDDQPNQQRITNSDSSTSNSNSGQMTTTDNSKSSSSPSGSNNRQVSRRNNGDSVGSHRHPNGNHPLSIFSPWLPTPRLPEMTVDFFTTPEAYNVHAALPGINKQDIKITVEEGMLNIQAERKQEVKQKRNSNNQQSATNPSASQSSPKPSTEEKKEAERKDAGNTSSTANTNGSNASNASNTESKYDNDGDTDMGQYDYIESSYGLVQRSFPLPDDVDVNGLSAKYEDGIIKVNIPRIAQKKPEAKRIEVQ